MGAAGMLMVSGPDFDAQDAFEPLNAEGYSVDIPVLRIKREVADVILSKSKNTVAALEKKLNTTRKPFSFHTKFSIKGDAEIVERNGKHPQCRNATAGRRRKTER